MGFDAQKFMSTSFKDRTGTVAVPELKQWFKKGDKPEFLVRGLNGHEIYQVNQRVERQKDIKEIIEQYYSSSAKERAKAFLDEVGMNDEVPRDQIYALELVVAGTVDPELKKNEAVRLCKDVSPVFRRIADKIATLTGQGRLPE